MLVPHRKMITGKAKPRGCEVKGLGWDGSHVASGDIPQRCGLLCPYI